MLEELQAIADTLATRLRRSVAIDNPQLELLVHTPHRSEKADQPRMESIMQKAVGEDVVDWIFSHDVQTATAPVRIPANDGLEMIARVCAPVRCQGHLLAYVWLLDADLSVTDDDLNQVRDAAEAAGQVLYRERLLGDLRRARERELLRDLLASDGAVRRHAAQELVTSDRLPEGAHVAVLAVRVHSGGQAVAEVMIDLALRRTARRLAPLRVIWTVRGGTNGLLFVAGRPPPRLAGLRATAAELHADLTQAAGPGATVHIGIGSVVASIDLAHESHSCAQDALRVAAHVSGFSEVAAWDDLGIYRLLVQLPLDQLRGKVLPAGLLKLAETDPSGMLMETLEIYLDEAGRAHTVIDRLQIHRTSLYYRLSRIERLTSMNLNSGSDRLALHLGIKLGRLIGILPNKL